MNWTESQLEAIQLRGRRVIVSAGAGSGKTRVLVERFIRLLEENTAWRVPDIVAVTFTEKAAREMVSRIRREIRLRIEQSNSPEERARWREHRNALDSARIGTIHALCASILRSHPAEAALDPAFEVIEEIAASALLDQAIHEAIDEAAREHSYHSMPQDSARRSLPSDTLNPIEIFAYLSTYDVQSALRSLIAQGEKARRAIARLNANSDSIFAFWRETIEQIRIEAARAIIERDDWRRDAETIVMLRANDPADKREQCRAQVADLLERLETAADSAGDMSDGELIVSALLEIESAINLRGGSKAKWPSEGDFDAVKQSLSRLRDVVRAEKLLRLQLNEADAVAAEVTARLVNLYEKTCERFAALKREQNALDFNDLEEITERMLTAHPEVCAAYSNPERGLIRALMVDEFQDTSPIQKRILWMIAPRSGELFIIGDSKQSIYRFRGADVTVFHEAREEFASNGGHEVGMDVCFRTHERLIDFVNTIFPAVFTRETRYDTPYEAMSARRLPTHDAPSVELHVITQDEGAETRLKADELREAEAAFIARRINEIIESGEVMVCEENEPRRAEPGDFALLFQASTSFEIYEQALADAAIPYVTIAGRGFYDRQEITDITNLLAFLSSPINSLRLAAVLRSPMFALSDETLLRLRLKRQSLWKALFDESIKHDENERDAIEFTRAALKRLREIVGRVSAAEAVVAAMRETGYLATLMSLPHGERRVANVEKFIEQARALSSMTLSELIERADDLKFKEAREGEATIEETGAVRLMTVHKSKGLEFPIVWIADATYKGASDKSIIAVHPEHGVSVRLTADHIETEDEDLRAASFEMLRLIEERMDAAEKKRLLYVAATRAREHLIISGAANRIKSSSDTWLGRVMRALGVDEDDRRSSIDYPGGTVRIGWHNADEILSASSAAHSFLSSAPSSKSAPVAKQDLVSAGESASEMFPLIQSIIHQ